MNVRGASDPLAAVGLGIATATNRVIIGHPCMIFRRQCQVHQLAHKKHLTAFTLVPVACNIVSKDGFLTLWKGSVSCGVLWALSHACELVIADVFNLPRTTVHEGSRERFWRHIILKAATYFVTTPFIVASFVETVRSSVGFSTEDTRLLDVIVNGFDRLRLDFKGKDTSKRFSLLYLSAPTVGLCTAHFLVSKAAFDVIYGMCRRYVSRKPPSDRNRFHSIMPEIFATMTSTLVADLVCYPVETVVHRLYIQGTRTLIDNMDNGTSAISLATKYDGFFHCLRSIIDKEGFWTLYSGVGAIALQYLLQFCILRLLRTLFDFAPNNHGNRLHVRTSPGSSSAVLHGGFESTGVTGVIPQNPSAQFAASEPSPFVDAGERNVSPPSSTLFPTFAQTQMREGSSAITLPANYSLGTTAQMSPPLNTLLQTMSNERGGFARGSSFGNFGIDSG